MKLTSVAVRLLAVCEFSLIVKANINSNGGGLQIASTDLPNNGDDIDGFKMRINKLHMAEEYETKVNHIF